MGERRKLGKRKLTVTKCKVLKRADNYVMYEVFAVDEAGAPVEAKLRSFSELEVNKLVEYAIEEYSDPRHGINYTLSIPGQKKGGGGVQSEMDKLIAKVNGLEARLASLEERITSGLESGDLEVAPPSPALATDHIPH